MWLVLAAVELGLLLAIAAPANSDRPGRAGGIRTAAAQLRGDGPPVDLVQDYVGARDVASGHEAYPVLTRAYASVGLMWPAGHRSTHPPTAFLLVLPVAWLPWKAAAAVWMVLMLALDAGAIGRYVTILRTASREQASRGENSALLFAADHNYGAVGVAVAVMLVAAVLVRALRRVRRRGALDRLSWDGVGWAGV